MSNFKENSGLEKDKPKTSQEEMDRMMKEFLAKGGKIKKLKPGYPKLGIGSLDKSGKPAWSRADIMAGKGGSTPIPDYSDGKKQTVESGTITYGDEIPKTIPVKKEKEY